MGNSDDEDDFAEYGTALEPIEEDEVAKRRPIRVEEQTAVDEKGRRRFHGAFTGGFSAGYFNTVGSKEGWAPSTFKSTRGEKKGNFKGQNVLDFMDDEDKGAFGIAPQILRPTDDFADKNESRARKRPLATQSEGPIPGVPLLEQIIQPVKETVGVRILVKMGWRPGKGVGPKVQMKAKKRKIQQDDEIAQPELLDSEEPDEQQPPSNKGKIYSCPLPPELVRPGSDSDDSDDLLQADELLAPDDVSSLLCNPKENTFGLGYKGLDRNALTSASSHVDLFGGSKLKFRMENKHLSISGQAFGTGAFEDNDEDIYSREDMSQYDFALETPEERRKRKAKEDYEKRKSKNKENCIDGFKKSLTTKQKRKTFAPPHLPRNFEPVHSTKKSRFEVSTVTTTDKQEAVAKGLGRHSLTISERQVLIEEGVDKERTEPDATENANVPTSEPIDGEKAIEPSVTAKPALDAQDIQHRIDRLKKFTQVLQAYTSNKPSENPTAAFKPFMKNPEKQERYEKYLTLFEAGFADSLRDLQPPEMAEWERDREKMEFERASKLYKPMNSILSSRFTSAKSHDISHLEPEKEFVKEKDPKDDPKVAAKMNLYGKLTHKCIEWHPDKLVCKRFNVPDPYPDSKFVGTINRLDTSGKTPSSDTFVPAPATNKKVFDAPKKSLFDNLDFSKPPPGLLPPGSTEGAATNPILAFQKELAGSAAVEITDEIPPEGTRPPLDLFKAIFADSSDESEEEESDTETATLVSRTTAKPHLDKKESQKSQNLPVGQSILPDNSSAKVSSNHGGKSPPSDSSNQIPPVPSASYKRRVFDRIDLDSMQEEMNTHGKSKDDFEDEDEEEYGPLPPRSTSSNNNIPTRHDLQKPKFIPRKPLDEKTKEVKSEEVVWVEKSALSEKSSKNRSKKKKRSSSVKKSHKKSSKKDKHKSHKGDKKEKKKKTSHKHKSKGKHRHESSSESDDDSSGASSDSSVTINDSLDNRALLAKLKQITKSK